MSSLLDGDEAASTSVKHWGEFGNKFSHLNIGLAVGMPADDIATSNKTSPPQFGSRSTRSSPKMQFTFLTPEDQLNAENAFIKAAGNDESIDDICSRWM